jgi:hypothetical protein
MMMGVAAPAPTSPQLTVELLRTAVEVLRPMLSQERLAEQLQEIRDGLAELATREADLQRREQRNLKIEAALGNLLEVGEVALFRVLHYRV